MSDNAVKMAGLLAAGVAMGGLMALLGFTHARFLNGAPPPPTRRRRRRQLRDSDSDEETSPRMEKFTSLARRSNKPDADNAEIDYDVMLGFSMEQARQMADQGHQEAMNRSPADVLADLQRGNVRFWTGQATRPEKSAFERRALISKQFPHTAILSCSDSRVPIEIVFDQGLGDMFVIRVAGNCLDTATHGSLQYAIHHLKVKVVIVMGHEGCGAIKAAQLPLEALNKEPETLGKFLHTIGSKLDTSRLQQLKDSKAGDREAVTDNVKVQVESLIQDEGIMQKVRSSELIMLGAFYELSSGIVDFFHEVSGEAVGEVSETKITRRPSRGVLTRCDKVCCP